MSSDSRPSPQLGLICSSTRKTWSAPSRATARPSRSSPTTWSGRSAAPAASTPFRSTGTTGPAPRTAAATWSWANRTPRAHRKTGRLSSQPSGDGKLRQGFLPGVNHLKTSFKGGTPSGVKTCFRTVGPRRRSSAPLYLGGWVVAAGACGAQGWPARAPNQPTGSRGFQVGKAVRTPWRGSASRVARPARLPGPGCPGRNPRHPLTTAARIDPFPRREVSGLPVLPGGPRRRRCGPIRSLRTDLGRAILRG